MIEPKLFRELYHNPDTTYRAKVARDNIEHLERATDSIPEKTSALEIGCYTGGTTVWLLERGFKHVQVIDTFEGSPEHVKRKTPIRFEFSRNTWEYRNRIVVHTGRSQEVLSDIAKIPMFDLIYVDGSHDSKDVILDAMLAWPLLKRAGVMVFDDYEWNYYDDPYRNPKPAIDFFIECYAKELMVLEKGYQVSVQKL